jgi:hypothetical protein
MPNTARRSELILRTIRPWQQSALSLKIACVYWKRRKLNPIAIGRYPRHDERINGGFNGLEDRSSYIRKAKEALVRIEGILTGAVSDPCPARFNRRRGRRPAGDAEQPQISPRHRSGFRRGDRTCHHAFSRRQKLTVDGIVGKETWDAIEQAAEKLEPVVTPERISCI